MSVIIVKLVFHLLQHLVLTVLPAKYGRCYHHQHRFCGRQRLNRMYSSSHIDSLVDHIQVTDRKQSNCPAWKVAAEIDSR